MLAFLLGGFGWGIVAQKLLNLPLPKGTLPAVGLAPILSIGSILILFEQVSKITLAATIGFGIVITAWDLVQSSVSGANGKRRFWSVEWRKILPYSGVLAMGLLTLTLNSRPTAYHLEDDLEKYLKYPIRLIQTGGLNTGLFDALGTETLGGMSFLHAFALLFGSLELVNAVDAVAGLIFAMSCAVAVLRQRKKPWWWCVLSSVSIAIVDPLYVNSSAAYIGVALLILAFALPCFCGSSSLLKNWRGSIFLGLIYSALVALKTTFALLIPVHFTFLLLTSVGYTGRPSTLLRASCIVSLSAALGALPWFLVHWEKFTNFSANTDYPALSGAAEVSERSIHRGWQPFALDAPAVGFLSSNALFSILALGIAVATVRELRRPRQDAQAGPHVAVLSAGLTVSFVYWIGLHWMTYRMSGPDSAIRYTMPLLIAGCLVVAMTGPDRSWADAGAMKKRREWLWSLLSLTLIALPFFPSFLSRVRQSAELGHAIGVAPFATPHYVHQFQRLAGDKSGRQVALIQDAIPPGVPVLAWITAPIHLNYARNPIHDVDLAGLTSPWLTFPFFGTPEEQVTSLKELGVAYVIWQHQGFGVRSVHYLRHREGQPYKRRHTSGRNGLAFVEFMRTLSASPHLSDTLYDDGEIRLFRLK